MLLTVSLQCQTVTLNVISASNTEPLVQAHAQNLESGRYAVADENGLIRMAALPGDSIQVRYVGYRDTVFMIRENKTEYEVRMKPAVLDEVMVFSEENFNRKASLGLQNIPMEFLETLPGLTGEPDILKSITFLPGVSGGREGYSHLYVRGGEQDQNLILYDGATLFNVNHAGGFISLFNTSLIRNVDFYKSYWPSKYGGRLSSVMDVRTINGNKEGFQGEVDIGIVTTKAHVSGPLFDNGKTSYTLGARTTFIDLFFLPRRIRIKNHKIQGNVPGYTFYDLNAKIDHRIDDRQSLSWSAYHGSDIQFANTYEESNGVPDEYLARYGLRNWTTSLNYSWVPGTRHNFRGHISYSRHRNYLEQSNETVQFDLQDEFESRAHSLRETNNQIHSLKGRLSGQYYSPDDWKLSYGMEAEQYIYQLRYDRYDQFQSNKNQSGEEYTDKLKSPASWNLSPFLDMEYPLTSHFKLKGGIRLQHFVSGDFSAWLPEPKAMATWDLSPSTTVNASYNHQHQPIHLVAYNLEAFFIENFILSDDKIAPASSHQWSLGYFRSLDRWIDNFSIEAFYKIQDDVLKYFPPYEDVQNIINFREHLHREGWTKSYGTEIMAQKTSGHFHGSIAYTWSRTQSVFPSLNQGKSFNADFDFRHQFNTLLIYEFMDEYKLSIQWVFKTGRPITWSNEIIPGGSLTGTNYEALDGINNERLPAYHRLDIGLKREQVSEKTGKRKWFGLNFYNAYFRKNPYTLQRKDGEWKIRSIFPIIPSINFGFEL